MVQLQVRRPANKAKPRAAVSLPRPDEYFEMRFESVGGLGAHAAGQVLATASVVRMGLNGAHFSSYGSEKKGSLIRSFVRLAAGDRPIRTSAPVDRPDVIVVFHAALLHNAVTFAGLKANGILVYNAPAGVVPTELAALPKTARVIRVDATGIAMKHHSRPNAVFLGTLCALCPFFDGASVLDALSEEFAGKHPEAVASNELAFRAGQTEFEELKGIGKAEGRSPARCRAKRCGATRRSRSAASCRRRATASGTTSPPRASA